MREILTGKCQGQEQDKGCHSHAAKEANGSQMEVKEGLSGVCPAHLGAALYNVKCSCLSCETAICRNQSPGKRLETSAGNRSSFIVKDMNVREFLIDNRTR